MKGIALHSIVPVRAEGREGAEQNTQMLFGEVCTILEPSAISHQPSAISHQPSAISHQPSAISHQLSGRWSRVKLDLDGQEGWVDAKMICPMKSEEFASYRKEYAVSTAKVVFPVAYAMSENNGQTIPLTAGTRLPNYKDGRFEVLGVGFRIDPSMVAEKPIVMNEQNLLQTVRFFLNVPYLWGGKNAMGMDCSGFTQVILSLFGKQLLRNASEQVTQGRRISDLKKAKAGDLAFFDHKDGRISHVGIVIDAERVIHCSGRVKVEKLDEIGIFNAERGEYSHHLVQIRRVL